MSITTEVEKDIIQTADNGNIGIGTTIPEETLHIKSVTDGRPPNIKQSMGSWYAPTANVYNYCDKLSAEINIKPKLTMYTLDYWFSSTKYDCWE